MLDELRKKSEHTRHMVALFTSGGVFVIMFSVWFYAHGYLGYSKPATVTANRDEMSQTASVYPASSGSSSGASSKVKYNSPVDNAKNTFSGAFAEIVRQYEILKESVSAVFVPFVSGIDVYEKSSD